MTDRTGPVRARGEVISSGRRIATARGELTDAAGKVIATGTTTCLVFPLVEPA
jgi:acyl-coenzyme A thioesterase PaaI-like protein